MNLKSGEKGGGMCQIRLPPFTPINLLTVVLAAILLMRVYTLYSTIDDQHRHIDEGFWLHGAYFYNLFFIERDFSNDDWNNVISYDVPPVGRYMLGFTLDVANNKIINSSGGMMSWERRVTDGIFRERLSKLVDEHASPRDERLLDYSESILQQLRNEKTVKLELGDYLAGRRAVFLFAVLSASLMAILCAKYLGGPFTGLLAALILLGNGMTIPVFQQVFPDSICCFFVLLALLTLIHLSAVLGDAINRKIVFLSLLEGLLLSLALGTRFTATYMAVTVFVAFAVGILLDALKSGGAKKVFLTRSVIARLIALAIISASTFIFFVLLNPFLYPNPIGNTLRMIDFRLTVMEIQSRVQTPAINTLGERLGSIYGNGVLLGYRMSSPLVEAVYILALLVGLRVLTGKAIEELKGGRLGPHTIVLLWAVTTFIVVGSKINMRWRRYFIPFVMCTAVVLASGLETMLMSLGLGGAADPRHVTSPSTQRSLACPPGRRAKL